MGYDVFITRAADPSESFEHPIREDEWTALTNSDLSLEFSQTDYFDRNNLDGTTERFHMVIWKGHDGEPPFMLIDGAILIKSPDAATIQKMVEIAGKLGARVVGEEGETYPLVQAKSENRKAERSTPNPTQSSFATWPLWKQVAAAFLLGCVLLALKLLIFGE